MGIAERWFRGAWAFVSYRLLAITHPSYECRGVFVRSFVGEAEHDYVRDRLDAALALIQRVHPIQFQKVQRHLAAIAVTPVGIPEFRGAFRACILPHDTVVNRETPKLAMVIVHEATHGRLHAWGLHTVPDECRERVERICVSQEVSLARRIDVGGEDWVSFAQRKLETRWWERDKIEERFAQQRERLRGME